jgi:hypothetical protein
MDASHLVFESVKRTISAPFNLVFSVSIRWKYREHSTSPSFPSHHPDEGHNPLVPPLEAYEHMVRSMRSSAENVPGRFSYIRFSLAGRVHPYVSESSPARRQLNDAPEPKRILELCPSSVSGAGCDITFAGRIFATTAKSAVRFVATVLVLCRSMLAIATSVQTRLESWNDRNRMDLYAAIGLRAARISSIAA